MKRIHTPQRTLLYTLATAAVLAMSTVTAQAQDELVLVEPVQSTMFINGGIGKGDQAYMSKIAKDWPLRMVFSAKTDNEYVADVRLLVTNTRGTPVLQLAGAGPITYAQLPAGHYRIYATHNGKVETRAVTLDGKTGHEVVFHWQGAPQS